jgi:hypothetical protein
MGWTHRATAMNNLNWTTTKPGWYWYHGESDGPTVKVLHFIDDDGDGPYLFAGLTPTILALRVG